MAGNVVACVSKIHQTISRMGGISPSVHLRRTISSNLNYHGQVAPS
jgi:hypothetical protein